MICQPPVGIVLRHVRGHALVGACRHTGEIMKMLRMLAALAVALAMVGAPTTLLARGNSGESSFAPLQSSQRTQQPSPKQDDHLIESGSYTNTAGNTVHRPAHTVSGSAPTGATAQCRDGSFSFSLSHRGTCSHHGGVASWL